MNKNLIAIFVFYLFVFLTMYFTKNMSLILLISLLGTSIINIIYNNNNLSIIENFESKKEGMDHSEDNDNDDDNDDNDDDDDDDNEDDNEDVNEEFGINEQVKKSQDLLDKLNKKENYQNNLKLNPAEFNFPSKKNLNKQLGKANNIESAYDNLEKIMGDNNIRSISNSTKELVQQQNELLKGLKNVTPALNEAMGALGKIDMNNLTSMFTKMDNIKN